jgi:hypothetical protein
MKRVKLTFATVAIIIAGFLIFTAVRYIDLLNNLSQTQTSGLCADVNTVSGSVCEPIAQSIPWRVLVWLIVFAIAFIDVVIAGTYYVSNYRQPHKARSHKRVSRKPHPHSFD